MAKNVLSMNGQIGVGKQLNETLQFWNLDSIGIKPTESSPSTNPSEAMVLKTFREQLDPALQMQVH